jgi:micrococcal nuclease
MTGLVRYFPLVLGLIVNFALLPEGFSGELFPDCPVEKNGSKREIMGTMISNSDGDTLRMLSKGEKYTVRLLSIDTPELHFLGKSQGHWGEVAREKLAKLLPKETEIRVEVEAEPCDRYGRILGQVFKGKTHINYEMVKAGLAVNLCMFPNEAHCKRFSRAVAKAIETSLGMFSDNTTELPYLWRRAESGKNSAQFVGNQSTFEVFKPGQEESVPIAERIFFGRKSHIKAPYQLVE